MGGLLRSLERTTVGGAGAGWIGWVGGAVLGDVRGGGTGVYGGVGRGGKWVIEKTELVAEACRQINMDRSVGLGTIMVTGEDAAAQGRWCEAMPMAALMQLCLLSGEASEACFGGMIQ